MKKFLIMLASFFVFLSAESHTKFHMESNPESTADFFIKKANELKLYEDSHWLNLLHFNAKKFDFSQILSLSNRSEIDSANFFFSPIGKYDPKAEMAATILAFFQPVESVEIPKDFIEKVEKINENMRENLPKRSSKKEDYHPICRYPARFAFLDAKLNLKNSSTLPNLPCKEFNDMKNFVAPKSATIVFPAAHINSPASMFGHTFLLLNSTFNSRLLSFAINYAAASNPNEENGISFALKGLLGMYPGNYSILPYYDKIKEYGDGENRDIWEFDLALNEDEISRMWAHIWELNDAWSYYYFFDENCSYAMLWLLEIARPGLEIRKKFAYQVIPTESIFALEKLGLISKETYRPSKRNIILSYENFLDSKDIKIVKNLGVGKLDPKDFVAKNAAKKNLVYILESAIEYAEFLYLKNDLEKENYVEIIHQLASVRSGFGSSNKPSIPTPKSPLFSNQNLRLGLYAGGENLSRDSTFIGGLNFRMAYHDLSENDTGFLKGAGVEFGKIDARFSAAKSKQKIKQKELKIEELKIVEVTSLGFISKFFTPPSYYIGTGFDRWDYLGNLSYYIHGGFGLSKEFGASYFYALLSPEFRINNRYKNSSASVNLGLNLGAAISLDANSKISLNYQLKGYKTNLFGNIFGANFNYQIAKNLAFMLEYKTQILPSRFTNKSEAKIGILKYF